MIDSYVLKEKFRNMKFYNLSPTADFNSKLQSQMTVMSGNILYITHEIDKIKKIVTEIKNDTKLQKQVDDYFEEGERSYPGIERTSPQTEQDKQ